MLYSSLFEFTLVINSVWKLLAFGFLLGNPKISYIQGRLFKKETAQQDPHLLVMSVGTLKCLKRRKVFFSFIVII
jgi:hypothetical protein